MQKLFERWKGGNILFFAHLSLSDIFPRDVKWRYEIIVVTLQYHF